MKQSNVIGLLTTVSILASLSSVNNDVKAESNADVRNPLNPEEVIRPVPNHSADRQLENNDTKPQQQEPVYSNKNDFEKLDIEKLNEKNRPVIFDPLNPTRAITPIQKIHNGGRGEFEKAKIIEDDLNRSIVSKKTKKQANKKLIIDDDFFKNDQPPILAPKGLPGVEGGEDDSESSYLGRFYYAMSGILIYGQKGYRE